MVIVQIDFSHSLSEVDDVKSICATIVSERLGGKEGPRDAEAPDVDQIKVAFPFYLTPQGFLNRYAPIDAAAQRPENVLRGMIPSVDQKYPALVRNEGVVT